MVASEEQNIQAEVVALEIVWRNPLNLVQTQLRAKEAGSAYYGWAEQAKRIRARRANWDVNHHWAA